LRADTPPLSSTQHPDLIEKRRSLFGDKLRSLLRPASGNGAGASRSPLAPPGAAAATGKGGLFRRAGSSGREAAG
jgi:hypothetical protein